MSDTAFVLIAHGAREASWALPLRRVADSVVAQAPELRVELAFMELMPPDLGECAEKLVAEGFRRIMVVPLFIARGGHLMRDVPEQLAALHQKYPATKFVVHHIIPINHPQVCGLHVAENLKVMSVAMKKALGRRLPKK